MRGPPGHGEDAGSDDDPDTEHGEVERGELLLELVLRLIALAEGLLNGLGPHDRHRESSRAGGAAGVDVPVKTATLVDTGGYGIPRPLRSMAHRPTGMVAEREAAGQVHSRGT
jgi:hypothetical protein